jgi:putative transposase
MQYRRAETPRATYFLTVVTFGRWKILCDPANTALLRDAFRTVKSRHPFTMDALVLLPDHLHCIWSLRAGDMDYPTRWMLIKRHFSLHCADVCKSISNRSRQRKRERSVWQRRHCEHQIRDGAAFEKHCYYINRNPVKYSLVSRVADWPHSSFHRFANLGIYPPN